MFTKPEILNILFNLCSYIDKLKDELSDIQESLGWHLENYPDAILDIEDLQELEENKEKEIKELQTLKLKIDKLKTDV